MRQGEVHDSSRSRLHTAERGMAQGNRGRHIHAIIFSLWALDLAWDLRWVGPFMWFVILFFFWLCGVVSILFAPCTVQRFVDGAACTSTYVYFSSTLKQPALSMEQRSYLQQQSSFCLEQLSWTWLPWFFSPSETTRAQHAVCAFCRLWQRSGAFGRFFRGWLSGLDMALSRLEMANLPSDKQKWERGRRGGKSPRVMKALPSREGSDKQPILSSSPLRSSIATTSFLPPHPPLLSKVTTRAAQREAVLSESECHAVYFSRRLPGEKKRLAKSSIYVGLATEAKCSYLRARVKASESPSLAARRESGRKKKKKKKKRSIAFPDNSMKEQESVKSSSNPLRTKINKLKRKLALFHPLFPDLLEAATKGAREQTRAHARTREKNLSHSTGNSYVKCTTKLKHTQPTLTHTHISHQVHKEPVISEENTHFNTCLLCSHTHTHNQTHSLSLSLLS